MAESATPFCYNEIIKSHKTCVSLCVNFNIALNVFFLFYLIVLCLGFSLPHSSNKQSSAVRFLIKKLNYGYCLLYSHAHAHAHRRTTYTINCCSPVAIELELRNDSSQSFDFVHHSIRFLTMHTKPQCARVIVNKVARANIVSICRPHLTNNACVNTV